MKKLKYRIEEFIDKMTVNQKQNFLSKIHTATRTNGSYILKHRSRLHAIRRAEVGDDTVNATTEQIRLIIKEIKSVFPEANLTFENIENIAVASVSLKNLISIPISGY